MSNCVWRHRPLSLVILSRLLSILLSLLSSAIRLDWAAVTLTLPRMLAYLLSSFKIYGYRVFTSTVHMLPFSCYCTTVRGEGCSHTTGRPTSRARCSFSLDGRNKSVCLLLPLYWILGVLFTYHLCLLLSGSQLRFFPYDLSPTIGLARLSTWVTYLMYCLAFASAFVFFFRHLPRVSFC